MKNTSAFARTLATVFSTVRAHIPDSGPLNIPKGETRESHVTANVNDEPAPLKYQSQSNSNPATAYTGKVVLGEKPFAFKGTFATGSLCNAP